MAAVVATVMIADATSEPANGPSTRASKFRVVIGEKIIGGTAAASTGRLNAVRMIHR